jgi:hypothetical protein
LATTPPFPFHTETSLSIAASAELVFDLLDDHRRLSSHMTKPSWMMAGSSMSIATDPANGHSVGSKIRLSGTVLGIRLMVEEVVTERQPPLRKGWQTIGAPRLLVIGPYFMGFALSPKAGGCLLRVFIDYDLPESGAPRLLGKLFGRFYAKWCTRSMAADAAEHFRSLSVSVHE